MKTNCIYTMGTQNGYETAWKTECGHVIVMRTPVEVGFAPAPLPNEDGKFCHYCGKVIQLAK